MNFAVYKGHEEVDKDRLAKLSGKIEHQTISSDTEKMLVKIDAYPRNFRGFQAEVRFSYGKFFMTNLW